MNGFFCCPVRSRSEKKYHDEDMSIGNTPVLMANPGLLEVFRKNMPRISWPKWTAKRTYPICDENLLRAMDDENLTIDKVAKDFP